MRPLLFCVLPLLAACASEAPSDDPFPAYVEPELVTDGPLPDIFVDGAASSFTLRPGLTLPDARDITWNGKTYSFRLLESGGEFPYPPPPPPPPGMTFPEPELIYPNMALIDGTEDPREAFIVKEIACFGGYDPVTSYSISTPPRYAPTGAWVFDVDTRLCDG